MKIFKIFKISNLFKILDVVKTPSILKTMLAIFLLIMVGAMSQHLKVCPLLVIPVLFLGLLAGMYFGWMTHMAEQEQIRIKTREEYNRQFTQYG